MNDWKCCEAEPPETASLDMDIVIRFKRNPEASTRVNYDKSRHLYFIFVDEVLLNIETKNVSHYEWAYL